MKNKSKKVIEVNEKDKKIIYQKWWFWCIIMILILGIIICVYNSYNTTFNNYKKQSISILNQYKNGNLMRKEAAEKIDALSDKLKNERKVSDETNIFYLEVKLSLIAQKLNDEELSNTQINTYMQEIKDL